MAMALAGIAAPAKAHDYDMRTATCKDVTDADPEDMELYFAWAVGYLAGRSDTTEVKGNGFERAIKRIRRFCLDNPAAPIVATMEQFIAGK